MTLHDRTGTAPEPAPSGGGSMLAQISNAMVRIHKEHWGKGPTMARTIYTEDVIVTRLEQIFTRAEITLIRAGRDEEVRHMRRAFQYALEHEFVGAVEQITGRKVRAFISETHTSAEIGIELFVLEPEAPAPDDSPS